MKLNKLKCLKNTQPNLNKLELNSKNLTGITLGVLKPKVLASFCLYGQLQRTPATAPVTQAVRRATEDAQTAAAHGRRREKKEMALLLAASCAAVASVGRWFAQTAAGGCCRARREEEEASATNRQKQRKKEQQQLQVGG